MSNPPNVRHDWDAVDWARSDADLAAEMGVTRQRVHAKRKKLGARAPVSTSLIDRVAALPVEELTTTEMAERLGVLRSSVAKVCKRLGRTPKLHATYQRSGTARERLEALDTGAMTVPEIAAFLESSPGYVYNLVNRYAIPYKRLPPGARSRKG